MDTEPRTKYDQVLHALQLTTSEMAEAETVLEGEENVTPERAEKILKRIETLQLEIEKLAALARAAIPNTAEYLENLVKDIELGQAVINNKEGFLVDDGKERPTFDEEEYRILLLLVHIESTENRPLSAREMAEKLGLLANTDTYKRKESGPGRVAHKIRTTMLRQSKDSSFLPTIEIMIDKIRLVATHALKTKHYSIKLKSRSDVPPQPLS